MAEPIIRGQYLWFRWGEKETLEGNEAGRGSPPMRLGYQLSDHGRWGGVGLKARSNGEPEHCIRHASHKAPHQNGGKWVFLYKLPPGIFPGQELSHPDR